MTREPLLTLDELAAEWRVSKKTLYREHARGRLKFQKVGGSTLVSRSEADRYLRANERTTAA